jgi:hypothetical protein
MIDALIAFTVISALVAWIGFWMESEAPSIFAVVMIWAVPLALLILVLQVMIK